MKTVGILGGMGPAATHAFYGHLIGQTDARSDQAHLHVVMDANPAIPDRTAFLVNGGDDPRPALITAAKALKMLGADFAVIPCNTASVFIEDITAASGLPVISWIAIAADALQDLGCITVGLLATSGTIRTHLYQDELEARGIAVLIPTTADQDTVMDVIYGPAGVKAQGFPGKPAQDDLLHVASNLADAGADAVLLGCTELPLTVPVQSAAWPLPAIDPAVHVARAAVALAGAPVRVSS
jgi:aspartate racemase